MARKTKVILISGKARHGKDTVANFMKDKLTEAGKPTFVYHFADPLKFVCSKYFNWDGEKDEKGRSLLQYVGTDVIRARDQNFWADFAARLIACFDGHWDFVIIPDARFPNEIEAFSKRRFKTFHLRVLRPNFDNLLSSKQRLHPSESALDATPPDYWVYNHGTLDTLKENVERWTEEFLLCKRKRRRK